MTIKTIQAGLAFGPALLFLAFGPFETKTIQASEKKYEATKVEKQTKREHVRLPDSSSYGEPSENSVLERDSDATQAKPESRPKRKRRWKSLSSDRLRDPMAHNNKLAFVGIYGLPLFESAKILPHLKWSLFYSLNVTNEYLFKTDRKLTESEEEVLRARGLDRCFFSECVIFDYEKIENEVGIRLGLFDFLELGIDYKHLNFSAGKLDHFVDDFHQAFRFPEAGRDRIVSFRYLIIYVRDGDLIYLINEAPGSGNGDLSLSLGVKLHEDPDDSASWAIKIRHKFPLGNPKAFFGSGSEDTAVELAYTDDRFGTDWLAFHLVAGLLRKGDFELMNRVNVDRTIADDSQRYQKDVANYTYAALNFSVAERWVLKTSLHYNSAFYDSDLEALSSDNFQLIAGAGLQISRDSVFDLGISENPVAGTSPDFSVFTNFKYFF